MDCRVLICQYCGQQTDETCPGCGCGICLDCAEPRTGEGADRLILICPGCREEAPSIVEHKELNMSDHTAEEMKKVMDDLDKEHYESTLGHGCREDPDHGDIYTILQTMAGSHPLFGTAYRALARLKNFLDYHHSDFSKRKPIQCAVCNEKIQRWFPEQQIFCSEKCRHIFQGLLQGYKWGTTVRELFDRTAVSDEDKKSIQEAWDLQNIPVIICGLCGQSAVLVYGQPGGTLRVLGCVNPECRSYHKLEEVEPKLKPLEISCSHPLHKRRWGQDVEGRECIRCNLCGERWYPEEETPTKPPEGE